MICIIQILHGLFPVPKKEKESRQPWLAHFGNILIVLHACVIDPAMSILVFFEWESTVGTSSPQPGEMQRTKLRLDRGTLDVLLLHLALVLGDKLELYTIEVFDPSISHYVAFEMLSRHNQDWKLRFGKTWRVRATLRNHTKTLALPGRAYSSGSSGSVSKSKTFGTSTDETPRRCARSSWAKELIVTF